MGRCEIDECSTALADFARRWPRTVCVVFSDDPYFFLRVCCMCVVCVVCCMCVVCVVCM